MRVLPTRIERSPIPTAAVVVASILVTLVFWTILPARFQINEYSPDYRRFYEPVARSILAGHGFITANGTPAISYSPGYPLVLAGIFGLSRLSNIPEEIVLSAFTLLSMGLASAFLFMLAKSVWGLLPALASALIWMTYPFALWLTRQPHSEMPFIVVCYGGFYLFCYLLFGRITAWPMYFLCGLLIGFAMLIRPIAIWATLVMGIILWLTAKGMGQRFRLFLITMMLLGSIVVILPWEIWVYANTGRIVPLRAGNLLDGLTYTNPNSYRQGVDAPPEVAVLMQDLIARRDEIKSLKDTIWVVAEELQTRPLAVVKLFAIKACRSWYATDSNRFETENILIQSPYLVLVLWGSLAAYIHGGISRRLAVNIWLMVLYFWGMTTVALSILRYMVPAMGLLFVLIPAVFLSREPEKVGNSSP
jgi:hypothetical protein